MACDNCNNCEQAPPKVSTDTTASALGTLKDEEVQAIKNRIAEVAATQETEEAKASEQPASPATPPVQKEVDVVRELLWQADRQSLPVAVRAQYRVAAYQAMIMMDTLRLLHQIATFTKALAEAQCTLAHAELERQAKAKQIVVPQIKL